MRYRKLFFPASLLFFLLTACIGQNPTTLEQQSEYGDLPSEFRQQDAAIQVSTDQESYTLPVKELHLVIENTGSTGVSFGAAIYLEKFEDNSWYQIPYKNMTFTDAEIGVAAGDTYVDEVPVDMIHYQLQEGTYRMLKEFTIESRQIVLATEFEIE